MKYILIGTYLLVAVLFSLLWGVITKIILKKNIADNLLSVFMNYCRIKADIFKFAFLWLSYDLVVVFIYFFSKQFFSFSFPRVFPDISFKEIFFLTCGGFISQLSISSFMLSLYDTFIKPINWVNVVSEIRWVSISKRLPKPVLILYNLVNPVVEEVAFRGVFFITLLSIGLNVWVSIFIVTLLFSLQQVLNVDNKNQVILIVSGSISISIIGCFLVLITNSIIPAVLCHQIYVMFYFDSN